MNKTKSINKKLMEEIEKIKIKRDESKEEGITIKDNLQIEELEKEDINLFFKKTLKNTLSAFFLSIISTIVNLACNIPLLRNVSKESYGIVKVHLELVFTLVNYIPRETIRRASQKFCPDKDPEKEKKNILLYHK